ncbi:MAG TPA: prepilin-type N-terminal cleavage/methylation domain-containing protein [Kofleriaceae bacterium]|jgi:general secretion pathway protein G|nr:prepilin-type N-terminal cleavage/methylation domain-containing protein [Kofleriaceae bacterium]
MHSICSSVRSSVGSFRSSFRRSFPRSFRGSLRRAQRGMTLLEIMIVLAILALVMGLLVGPKVMEMFASSKDKTTAMKLKMFAYQAYPSWSTSHPEKDCPETIAELNPFMNNEDMNDSWGTPITMVCGASAPPAAHGFGVVSAGPDHKPGTADDLHSW